MTHRALPLLLALTACSTEYGEPFAVRAEIDPLKVTIPDARYNAPPGDALFTIQNTGASTIYVTPAPNLAEGKGKELLVVDLPPYSQVLPEQKRPLKVTLDNRPWRWGSGEYTVKFPFEIRYYFSGQDVDEPEIPPSNRPPEPQAEIFELTVDFVIDCDLDDDGFDSTACSGGRDCDDSDDRVRPNASETCRSADENCDGSPYGGAIDTTTYYFDGDNDGFGDPDTKVEACIAPSSKHITTAGDCDDTKPLVRPGIREDCSNMIDDDCDGKTDLEDDVCMG